VLLGSVYAFQKNDDKAISAYDQAIKKDAQDFRPVLAKAMLFKEQGKLDKAKPLFDSATALAPAQYKDEINKAAASNLTPPEAIVEETPQSTPEAITEETKQKCIDRVTKELIERDRGEVVTKSKMEAYMLVYRIRCNLNR
jgi:tetratricopeptide (TPR) repeat protein